MNTLVFVNATFCFCENLFLVSDVLFGHKQILHGCPSKGNFVTVVTNCPIFVLTYCIGLRLLLKN